VQLGFENVGLDDVNDLLLLCAFQREEGTPPGVLVADEAPVEAGQEVEYITNAATKWMKRTQPNQYCW